MKISKKKLFFFIFFDLILICIASGSIFLIIKTYQLNLGYFQKNTRENNQIFFQKKSQIQEINKDKNNKNQSASVIFVGDLMFDRSIRQFATLKGNDYIFEKIYEYLVSADLVVANLEGPITKNKSVSINTLPDHSGHYKFTFDLSLGDTLNRKNIKMVNLGNNHILNFGQEGLIETKENLTNSKIKFFGDIDDNFSKADEVSINNISFVFINYNQFAKGSLERSLNEIKKNKDHKIIVVYTHWGIEYVKEANEEIRKIAHSFVDAGADLVIGTHPHVVQNKEKYQEKMIYYSLGNFIFDQYFSSETEEGLAIKVICNQEKICRFEEKKVKMKTNGQTELVEL